MNHWIIAPVVLPAILAPFIIMVLRHHLDLQRIFSVAGSVALLAISLMLTAQAADGTVQVYELGNWPAPFGIVLVLDRLSALDFVTFTALTHGVADADQQARIALRHVDLDADDPKPVGSFSKGMRQRAKLAAAIVNDPDVLILDEPLTGLDPVQRQRMITLFNQLADAGKCLLVSSHVLDEVARLGSKVLVIAQGRLAAAGDYHSLRDQMDDRPHRIRIATDQPRLLGAALIHRGLASGVTVDDGGVSADTTDVDAFGRAVAPLAVEFGARLNEFKPLDDDLESVFRYLVEGR